MSQPQIQIRPDNNQTEHSGFNMALLINIPDSKAMKDLNDGIENMHLSFGDNQRVSDPKGEMIKNYISSDLLERLDQSSPFTRVLKHGDLKRKMSEISIDSCENNGGEQYEVDDHMKADYKVQVNENRIAAIKDNSDSGSKDQDTEDQSPIGEFSKQIESFGNLCQITSANTSLIYSYDNIRKNPGIQGCKPNMVTPRYWNNQTDQRVHTNVEGLSNHIPRKNFQGYNHEAVSTNPNESSVQGNYTCEMFGRTGWICAKCNNFNYESRLKCNRCGVSKSPKLLKTKTQTEEEEKCNNESNNNNSNNSSDKKKKKPFSERAGDWICMKCKNLNFSFRVACNRCQLPKGESEKLLDSHVSTVKTFVQASNLMMRNYPYFVPCSPYPNQCMSMNIYDNPGMNMNLTYLKDNPFAMGGNFQQCKNTGD